MPGLPRVLKHWSLGPWRVWWTAHTDYEVRWWSVGPQPGPHARAKRVNYYSDVSWASNHLNSMLVKGTLAITTTYTLASSVIQDYIPLNVIEYVGWRLFIFKCFWNAKNSDIESAYQIGVDNYLCILPIRVPGKVYMGWDSLPISKMQLTLGNG